MPNTYKISRKYMAIDTGATMRQTPSTTGKVVMVMNPKTIFIGEYLQGTWIYTTKFERSGWVHIKQCKLVCSVENVNNVVPSTNNNTTTTNTNPSTGFANSDSTSFNTNETTTTDNSAQSDAEKQALQEQLEAAKKEELLEEYTNYFNTYGVDNNNGTMRASAMNGIFGMPYQFSKLVDPKLEGDSEFGQKYAEKIVTKIPLMLISPGKVDFMPGNTKTDAVNIFSDLANKKFGKQDDLDTILQNSGRYYSFKYDFPSYFNFVNPMCRSCATFLGLEDVEVTVGGYKDKLGNFNWENINKNDFGTSLDASECVAFYVDSVNTVSDSFSNSTTESQIASKINSFSDVGKEISFLLGTQAGIQFDLLDQDAIENTMSEIENLANKYVSGNQLFKDIGSEFATVAAGGKLIFPEIWDDSQFTRSFDISIKLRTPDNDDLSWYMNICVPLCFLIGLVAPKQVKNIGYFSPHLVRAFYKGLFNVDMGIITDLSFTKGKEGAWNINGLPTEVDVSMTIKDLYQAVLAITDGSLGTDSKWFINNTTLMDYMANMCGININKPDLFRTFEIYSMLQKNKFLDIPNKFALSMENFRANIMMKAYNGIVSRLW